MTTHEKQRMRLSGTAGVLALCLVAWVGADGTPRAGADPDGVTPSPQPNERYRVDVEAALRSGEATVDAQTWALWIPAQASSLHAEELAALRPEISPSELTTLQTAIGSIAAGDLERRRAALVPFWTRCGQCVAREEPSLDVRVAAIRQLLQVRRQVVSTLLAQEVTDLEAELLPTLGRDRAVELAREWRMVRELDHRRLLGARLPGACTDLLRFALGEESGHAREVLWNNLPALLQVYETWMLERDEALVCDEIYRTETERASGVGQEYPEAARAMRREAKSKRIAALGGLVQAEQRIVQLNNAIVRATVESLPKEAGRALNRRYLVHVYGTYAIDPWDCSELLKRAALAADTSPDPDAPIDPLLAECRASADKTVAEVIDLLDNYWLERLRTWSIKRGENDACAVSLRAIYERAQDRAEGLIEILESRTDPERVDQVRMSIDQWRALAKDRQKAALRLPSLSRSGWSAEP